MGGIQLSAKKKITLVLGGGGIKAASFHTGVVMALERLGYAFAGGTTEKPVDDNIPTISSYVGASAGSFIATFLAQGGRIRDLVGAYKNSERKEGDLPPLRYRDIFRPRVDKALSLLNLDALLLASFTRKSFQSPFNTEGIRKYLINYVTKTDKFSDLVADLFIVCCEVNEPRKVIFSKHRSFDSATMLEYRDDVAISDACAASMALPPLFHPYRIQIDKQARDFFDGEIREPLSMHIPNDMGSDLAICSYTCQPLWLRPESGSFADLGVQSIGVQALNQMLEKSIRMSRGIRRREQMLLKDVQKFCKAKGIAPALADELIKTITHRFQYRPDLDYIFIHPLPSDSQMFHLPNFSLNDQDAELIIRKGYRATMLALPRLFAQTGTSAQQAM